VLTDDARIEEAAREFGAQVLMTSSACRNGTERCAEAVALLPRNPRIVVNLQGDAPLTPAWYVEGLIEAMRADPAVTVATPVLHASAEHLRRLRPDRQAGRVGGTTAVLDRHHDALYFSKEVLPFTDHDFAEGAPTGVYHHVGVYAYTPAALTAYSALPQGDYELREGLEQLRFLENGVPVRCVEVEARAREFWELNNPSDIATIEAIMKKEGLE
jgi:3-deoxy-manno-octulosonate cytidylyltransferase (CMP-KDO synthetase)